MTFAWGTRTFVMGILNATPDSFSGDGIVADTSTAVAQAQQFADAGADIIDIGGQSTRPGSELLSPETELARVLPIIKAVRKATNLPISIDTFYASVASAALDAGANWINDVWGLRMDPEMAPLAAKQGCPIIIMHNRSRPKNVAQADQLGSRYIGIEYDDLIENICSELNESITIAHQAGVQNAQLILDPGIGFGKTVAQNCAVINHLDAFKRFNLPILLGPSRKSFIGYTLDLPPDQRVEGTAAAITIGIDRGADLIRVHDVEAMVRVARMTDAITRTNSAVRNTV